MNDIDRSSRDFRLGSWTISPDLNQIRQNSKKIVLQNLSMQVLLYLAERRGGVVTYDELLDSLWQNRYVGEDAIHRRIADLRRHLGDDRKNPTYIETIPKKGYRIVAPIRPTRKQDAKTLRWIGIAAGAITAVVALALLTERDDDIRTVSGEVELVTVSIESKPPGATVSYLPYAAEDEKWQSLGITPLQAKLPDGAYKLRFVADGHKPVTMAAPNPSMVFNNVNRDFYVVKLPAASSVPKGMVYVPGGAHRLSLLGINRDEDIGEFYIGRTEVSNRKYAEFVNARGYETPEYWQELEDSEGDFEFAFVAERFVDTTQLPGPAGWANGTYPEGAANLPVTGVSWFEAKAYARYRGMKLPTAKHWARAAFGIDESRWPLAPSLIAAARTDSVSPVAVDDTRAMSTWGSLHMIGNVREWTTTRDGEARLSLGLGYASQKWGYAFPGQSLAMQRAADQGIRLAVYNDDFQDMRVMMNGVVPEVPDIAPGDLDSFIAGFEYVQGSVTPETVSRKASIPEYDWLRDQYLIESDVLSSPMPVLIFRPRDTKNPLQPVIFIPPGDSYGGTFPSSDIDITNYGIDFVVRSGRALVWPIITGTHERV